ncbi:MAG: pentapeptide repeat-containing protein [Chloroflexi bacterium OLB15]|nr:MAG: pentapeptide repeat-containing protein [Chloroflexi bacterium OLB15]
MKLNLKQYLSGSGMTAQRAGVLFLLAGIFVIIIGYPIAHPGEPFDFRIFVSETYTNISSELIGIAITVLIIDAIYRKYESRNQEQREREQLIRQLGSSVNEVAKRASEELRARGWLSDGSLQEMDFRIANLEAVKLWGSDLQGANLQWAKLKHANLNDSVLAGANLTQANLQAARLRGADLRGANLFEAKLYRINGLNALLQNANLNGAHLQGARLENADLRGATFTDAHFDELTIMPDGARWSSECDLERFTNPAHPNFFRQQTIRSDATEADTETDLL